jgi:hypothetical protein
MGPPTELLVRDYLKRLSAAARGQLGPDDRRALVDRTRELIEREASVAGPPTPMDVARLLAGLGDPSRLVQQERERLAAVRGEMPAPAASRTRFPRALRRDPARARTASWHWPVQEGNRSDLQLTLLDGSTVADVQADAALSRGNTVGASAAGASAAGASAAGASAAGASAAGASAAGASAASAAGASASAASASAASASGTGASAAGTRDLNGTARNGVSPDHPPAEPDEPAARVPAQGGEPSWFMLALGGRAVETADQSADSAGATTAPDRAEAVPARPRRRRQVARDASRHQRAISDVTTPGDSVPSSASPAWQLTTPRDPAVAKLVRRVVRAVAAWYRRSPLDASALVLLGLGGVIYPPIWLLGAATALASRTWDTRDKWIGLALPVLLTLIGTAVGVADGGHVSGSQGVHEGWVYAVAASRVAAALSACYLGWRTVHRRRPPPVPPWNRPHKIG